MKRTSQIIILFFGSGYLSGLLPIFTGRFAKKPTTLATPYSFYLPLLGQPPVNLLLYLSQVKRSNLPHPQKTMWMLPSCSNAKKTINSFYRQPLPHSTPAFISIARKFPAKAWKGLADRHYLNLRKVPPSKQAVS